MKNSKLRVLTECAIMVALATVLSFIKVYEMPLGGSITLASTLPLAVISYRHGLKAGIPTAFIASGIQLLLGLNNLAYGNSVVAVLTIVFMDYLVAFTVIGLAGMFRKFNKENTRLKQCITLGAGIFVACVLRFFCHFISGAVVWYSLTKEWYADDPSNFVFKFGKWTYSFIYNISYMAPELLVTLAVGILLAMFINFKSDNLIFSKKA